MTHARARQIIVAGAEQQIVEREIARQQVGLFVLVMMVRRKFRAGLRADQERDPLLLAIVPQHLALDARSDEFPYAFIGPYRARSRRGASRLPAHAALLLDA